MPCGLASYSFVWVFSSCRCLPCRYSGFIVDLGIDDSGLSVSSLALHCIALVAHLLACAALLLSVCFEASLAESLFFASALALSLAALHCTVAACPASQRFCNV